MESELDLRTALDALRGALTGRAPEPEDIRARLVRFTTRLVPDDPLDPTTLDDPRAALAWVLRRDTTWELWQPGQPPSEDFAGMVLDGRPDLTAPDADLASLAPELVDADPRNWVAFGHGHDGHRFLFWDTTAANTLKVLQVDNTDPEVITGGEDTTEEFLVLRILPDLLDRRNRSAAAPPTGGVTGTIGCGVVVLAIAVGLAWWLLG